MSQKLKSKLSINYGSYRESAIIFHKLRWFDKNVIYENIAL